MDAPLAQQAQALANDVLMWVGFGTLVGLLAKAIMPGRDPGGTVATLCMGIGGSVVGCGILAYYRGEQISPITPVGFLVATGGAFVLLFFYRLLAGHFFVEGDPHVVHRQLRRRRRSRRPRAVAIDAYDD